MATLAALLAADRKLRNYNFTDKLCRLLTRVETRGGTVFEADEIVRVIPGHRGKWRIRSLTPQSNGCHKNCTSIPARWLELVGDVPPPTYVPPPRPEMFPCKNCETPIGRDLAFRGCCNVACWCQAHPDAADRIVRSHFKRAKD